MQSRHNASADYATLHYVAVPMDVAHVATLSVRHTASENRISLLWRNLAQYECPRPANGRVSRRIRAVLPDSGLLAGGTNGLIVQKKGTLALIFILGSVG